MNRPSKIWGWAAGIFVVINLLGAIFAAAMGERAHADVHLVLMLIGAVGYLAWRSLSRGRKGDPAFTQGDPALTRDDPRLDYLQQSVDAVALEVERLGEAQRAKEKLQREQIQSTPPKKDQ
ncbi:MAG: hypothetical protein ACREMS_01215 [Gemmatimonadaceae bacterium]